MAAEKIKPVQIDISTTQILSFADLPTQFVPIPPPKYVGRMLSMDKNVMKVGVCIENRSTLDYHENDEITVTYIELRMMYMFRARIISVREVQEYDSFNIDSMGESIIKYITYNLYIFNILPLTEPVQQQRREYFRIPFVMDIYYKTYSLSDANKNLKFEIETAKELKKFAENGILEKEEGYKKITTIDISAGGFRSKTREPIEDGEIIDCMLVVDNEALPVIAKILHCKSDENIAGMFDVRAYFYKISDPVRNRLIKFFFMQQRQIQNKFIKKK